MSGNCHLLPVSKSSRSPAGPEIGRRSRVSKTPAKVLNLEGINLLSPKLVRESVPPNKE